MKKNKSTFTYDEIDKMLEATDKEAIETINWKVVSEDEIESLLKKSNL